MVSSSPPQEVSSSGDRASDERSLEALIQAAQHGDAEALEQLLSGLAPRLRRFGQRLCGQAGEDALQEALFTLAGKLSDFRGESQIYSWAFALVRSACARQTRGLENAPKQPLTARLLEAGTPGGSDRGPEARLIERQRSEELNCALASLEEGLRAAVVLRDIEELPASQAAEVLGISVAALKSRLHRGRKALAVALANPERRFSGCPDVIAGYSAEREGELSPERCAELHRHLEGCPACLRRCQDLTQALEDARTVPPG